MINYETRDWWTVLLRVRGTVVPRIALRLLIVTAVAAALSYLELELGVRCTVPNTVHTIVGVALGLLLVFRTNTSYDRFWEGRRLLGAMVNTCRDLARQSRVYLAAGPARDRMRGYVDAQYATIRRYLRGEREWPELSGALSSEELARLAAVQAPPLLVASWISELVRAEADAGRLSEERLRLFDNNVTRILDHWGGCERIVKTPVPFAYAHHIKAFLTLFCLTVPLPLLGTMGWYTPLAALLVGFALLGIDEIGVEIEDPFGYDANDLPLDAIGDTIALSVADALPATGPAR